MKIKRKNSLSLRILKGVGIAGLIVLAAASPYFGLSLIRGFKKYSDKKQWRKFYASLDYLNRRGYVKILEREDGKVKVKITRAGEDRVEKFDIESMKLKKPQSWDGKWRVIVFDVPVVKNKNRKAFTDRIKELGFVMIQKSVWAYPYDCYDELAVLRKFFEVQKYITYFEAVNIEDEKDWRGKFNLRDQN